MHKSWRLQGPSETCVIAPRSHLVQEEQDLYLSAQLDRWLADPLSLKTLLDMYESLRSQSAALARKMRGAELQRYVKAELLDAFRRGELVLLRIPHVGVFPTITMPAVAGVGPAREEPPPERARQTDAGKTWAEIELVDQDGDPVPNVRYLLELADGTRRPGTLDVNGRAHIKDLDPGTYKVSFPDFDGTEWDAAK